MSDAYKGYRFTTNGSAVTAVYEVEHGRMEMERMENDETWSFDGANVIKTEWDDGRLETTTYSDADGDGLFFKTNMTYSGTEQYLGRVYAEGGDESDDVRSEDHSDEFTYSGDFRLSKGYSFEFDANGNLVALFESEHGVLQPERVDWDETYVLQADGTVVKTELDDGGTEITIYADTNGDGLFERVSETWTSIDGRTVQSLSYTGSWGDDLLAVRSGDDAIGGLGADNFVIREAAHLRIEDFDDTEGDHLVFDTGYGLTKLELEHYVTGLEVSGADLIVHFGADVSITLVGVAGSQTLSWDDVTVLS